MLFDAAGPNHHFQSKPPELPVGLEISHALPAHLAAVTLYPELF